MKTTAAQNQRAFDDLLARMEQTCRREHIIDCDRPETCGGPLLFVLQTVLFSLVTYIDAYAVRHPPPEPVHGPELLRKVLDDVERSLRQAHTRGRPS